MAKVGRPTLYTPELGADICRRIAQGAALTVALREIEAETGSAPAYDTVMEWLGKPGMEEFTRNYARAREQQADWDADHLRGIASRLERCGSRDEADGLDKAAKLYQWLAGKRKPKVYGDLQKLEHSGEVKVVHQKLELAEPPEGWAPDGG
jgi:hypothetical protein